MLTYPLNSLALRLFLPCSSFILYCATIQFKALRAGQKIQGPFLLITILTIFLAYLEIFHMPSSPFISDYKSSTDKQGKSFFFYFCRDLHKCSAPKMATIH